MTEWIHISSPCLLRVCLFSLIWAATMCSGTLNGKNWNVGLNRGRKSQLCDKSTTWTPKTLSGIRFPDVFLRRKELSDYPRTTRSHESGSDSQTASWTAKSGQKRKSWHISYVVMRIAPVFGLPRETHTNISRCIWQRTTHTHTLQNWSSLVTKLSLKFKVERACSYLQTSSWQFVNTLAVKWR